MSLSRRRRRKQGQRRHHEARPANADASPEVRRPPFSPKLLFEERALDESHVTAPQGSKAPDEHVAETVSSSQLREAAVVERLAYTRRQAAEALGVSLSTIDRRVVPAIETVKTPWGQRLIPAEGIQRLMRTYREPARGRPAPRHVGRPATLPRSVVERIRLEYARGRGLSEIARMLTAQDVPTAHGGRQWWPSTVRAVLVRPHPRTPP